MYEFLYGTWNHTIIQLPISLKTINMRYWKYQRSTLSDKYSEKESSEIPSENQSQHSLSRMVSINLRRLPNHNLLTQVFKHSYRKTLYKYVPKLIKCINFQNLETTINNILIKPNSLVLIHNFYAEWIGLSYLYSITKYLHCPCE